jgi:hypothetical protein
LWAGGWPRCRLVSVFGLGVGGWTELLPRLDWAGGCAGLLAGLGLAWAGAGLKAWLGARLSWVLCSAGGWFVLGSGRGWLGLWACGCAGAGLRVVCGLGARLAAGVWVVFWAVLCCGLDLAGSWAGMGLGSMLGRGLRAGGWGLGWVLGCAVLWARLGW